MASLKISVVHVVIEFGIIHDCPIPHPLREGVLTETDEIVKL